MDLSVAIATRNRRDLLLRTLERLQESYAGVDIIVADNGSGDGTPDAVRRAFPGVRVIETGANRGAYARTLAAQAAKSELLAFCDDDTYWPAGALERAARTFERYPRLGLLCAKLLIEPDMRLDPVCELMRLSPLPRNGDVPGPPVLGFLACAAVVRRRAFLDAGGFHPEYGIGGEEELLAIDMTDAGWALCYVDELVAYHAPAQSGRNPYKRRAVQVRNRLWTAWLREPLVEAASSTYRALAFNATDAATWLGLSEAMKGLSWVRRERRVASAAVRQQLRMLR